MTQDFWVAKHPYLQGVADLQALIDATLAEIPIPGTCVPRWDNYISDFYAGIPLLRSPTIAIEFRDVETVLTSLVESLALKALPGKLAQDNRTLEAQLHIDRDSPRRALDWLVDDDSFAPTHPGLLRYLGWTVLARYLSPVVSAFNDWRDEERWLRSYCPMCGALAAMAQAQSVTAPVLGRPPIPLVLLLSLTLAVPANRLSVLPKSRQSPTCGRGGRGRGRSPDRLLRSLQRIRQDICRAGKRVCDVG